MNALFLRYWLATHWIITVSYHMNCLSVFITNVFHLSLTTLCIMFSASITTCTTEWNFSTYCLCDNTYGMVKTMTCMLFTFSSFGLCWSDFYLANIGHSQSSSCYVYYTWLDINWNNSPILFRSYTEISHFS